MRKYSKEKKFFFGALAKLGHSRIDEMYLADDDVMDVFTFLNNTGFRDNTTVVVFGDHGFRTGKSQSW